MAATDNFNRPDENPLNPTNWGVPTPFGLQVLSNQCASGNTTDTGARESAWRALFGPDSYSQILVVTRPAATFLVVLTVRSSNFTDRTTRTGYKMEWARGGNCVIKRENGDNTTTTLATAVGPTFNDGDTVMLSAVGSTISVVRNGSVAVTSANDTTYGTAGYCGIGVTNNTGSNIARLDDFVADTFPGAQVGQYVTHRGGRGAGW